MSDINSDLSSCLFSANLPGMRHCEPVSTLVWQSAFHTLIRYILPVPAGGLPFLLPQERKQRMVLGEALRSGSRRQVALPQVPLPASIESAGIHFCRLCSAEYVAQVFLL